LELEWKSKKMPSFLVSVEILEILLYPYIISNVIWSVSPGGLGFLIRPVPVGFVDEIVALVQKVFRVLWLFPVNIIPLRLRIVSFICHQFYVGWTQNVRPDLQQVKIRYNKRENIIWPWSFWSMIFELRSPESPRSVHLEFPCRHCRKQTCGALLSSIAADHVFLTNFLPELV